MGHRILITRPGEQGKLAVKMTPRSLEKVMPNNEQNGDPKLPWKTIKERIKGLRESGILGWISCVRMEDLPEDCILQKCSQKIPFTEAIRNVPVRGVPRSL